MDEMLDAPVDEGAILTDYRNALREVLGDIAPGVAGIHGQLQSALAELREGEGGKLLLALQNLGALFDLLGRLTASLGSPALPSLDRFDARVRGFLDDLERSLSAAPEPAALCARVEARLLPALEAWPTVEAELAAAVDEAVPTGEEVPPEDAA